ncbi:MAG: tRNA pseudouridine(55) synthase TruB [Solirubrobacterales bacterium]
MNGFVNLNKPEGMTSYDVIRRLKPVLQKCKVGHTGTLDPMATGVLPIALGMATRLIEYIGDSTKVYDATMILGGESDTQDRTGTIQPNPHSPLAEDTIAAELMRFMGEIEQVPPMYSAVHYEGQRLYELARQGVTVAPAARKATIYQLKLISVDQADGFETVRFSVACSSGTYIRTLCHDLGKRLGPGGYLSALVRTRSGPFRLEASHTIEEALADIHSLVVRPADILTLPVLAVRDEETFRLRNGMPIAREDASPGGCVQLVDSDGELIAVASVHETEGRILVKPEKVFQSQWG